MCAKQGKKKRTCVRCISVFSNFAKQVDEQVCIYPGLRNPAPGVGQVPSPRSRVRGGRIRFLCVVRSVFLLLRSFFFLFPKFPECETEPTRERLEGIVTKSTERGESEKRFVNLFGCEIFGSVNWHKKKRKRKRWLQQNLHT